MDTIETLTELVEAGLKRNQVRRRWFRDAVTALEVELCLAEGDRQGAHEAMSLYSKGDETCPSRK